MFKFKRMKKYARNLVGTANTFAIGYYVPLTKEFPFVAEIDTKRCDYFITIACITVAISGLHEVDIPESQKEAIKKIIVDSLTEKYPEGIKALNHCIRYMNEALYGHEELIDSDVLGRWIAVYLFGRDDLSDREEVFLRPLGAGVIIVFKSYWK